MKTNIKYIVILLSIVSIFYSCSMNLEPLSDTHNRIAVVFDEDLDSVYSYTFAYYTDDFKYDTVYVELTVVGTIGETDRKVSLVQRQLEGNDPDGTPYNNAVAGKHYVAFDDSSIADKYVIKAGATGALIPIVLLRDATLKDKDYTLQFDLVANEEFQLFSPINSTKRIVIADQLLKPSLWDGMLDYYFTGYGKEKHKLMNEVVYNRSGEFVNDDWLRVVKQQQAYISMWKGAFAIELAAINEARKAANGGVDDPLKEGPEYGSVEVRF